MLPNQIGPYEIFEKLPEGGMATIYVANDPNRQQEVVVKVLPAQFTHDPKFRERFAREAEVMKKLRHPAIVPVYDYGEDNGTPYLVMKYMRGGTLASMIGAGPVAVNEAARILRPIAEALDYAHQQGVVHRDVKPANIYFDERGVAYLGDFGVVQLAEATHSFTGSAVIGTPAYMSPEQVKGGAKVDGRSDIYSLGIVLYEMLSGGDVPFKGETPTQQLMKHVLEPVPHICEKHPQIPPVVDAILMKALAKSPAERYPTAVAFIVALATGRLPVQKTEYGPIQMNTTGRYTGQYVPQPAAAQGRKLPALFAGAAFLLLFLCAGTGVLALPTLLNWLKPQPTITVTPPAIAVLPDSTDTPPPTATFVPPTASQTPAPTGTLTPVPADTQTISPSPTATIPNNPPALQNDNASTSEGQGVTVNVMANDADPEGSLVASSLIVIAPPSKGQAQADGQGNILYTPQAGYSGPDQLTYKVCDAVNLCAQANVTFQVVHIKVKPTANGDSKQTQEDSEVTIPVTANDSDPDGDITGAQINVQQAPEHGTATVLNMGSVLYKPSPNYSGQDQFTYQVCDVDHLCAEAQVRIDVIEVNDQPTAQPDTVSTNEDETVVFRPTGNDVDLEGQLKVDSLSVVSPAKSGAVASVGSDLRYTPRQNFNGTDRFAYQVCDTGNLCAQAQVTLNIAPVNDPPTIQANLRFENLTLTARTVPYNGKTTRSVLNSLNAPGLMPYISDVEGDKLQFFVAKQPAWGSVDVYSDGTFDYFQNRRCGDWNQFDLIISDGHKGGYTRTTITFYVKCEEGGMTGGWN